MKRKLLLILSVLTGLNAFAQNVTIPDTNFKTYLLNAFDSNNDSEISVGEAENVSGTISATGLGIADLTGIEAFVNITTLEVFDNNLTSLDVSHNTSLTRLHCANNQITALDVSDIPTLTEVHCQNNALVELNLANGNNSSFVYMKSYGNSNLTCIQHDAVYSPDGNVGLYDIGWTKDNTSSYSRNCANFNQIINIPDANFKTYLLNAFDSNNDGEISVGEAENVSGTISATGLGIADLTGIEAFVNITTLEVFNNNLTSLDVSHNIRLTRLHCANNQITALDVSDIPTLTEVHCQNNALVELNLANGNNSSFEYMKSYGNSNLTCIQHDVVYSPGGNVGLYDIGWTKDNTSSYSRNCANFNQIINIPDANFKTYLLNAFDSNNDGEITGQEAENFSGTISATGLGITDLTGIEAFVNITTLEVFDNDLTSLDVSHNIRLTRLHCANNQITVLDVSNNPILTEVHCQNNALVELNLANGNNSSFVYMKSYGNSNLTCIQHDASYTPQGNVSTYARGWTKDSSSSYSTECQGVVLHVEQVYESVNLYPNPVVNTLFVDASVKILTYQLYDVNDNLVKSSNAEGDSEIDVSALSSGIYFLKINTIKGQHIQKIIKQ